MKTTLFFLMINCLATLLIQNLNAQPKYGTSMKPILTDAINYIDSFEDKNFEIVRMEFDIIIDSKSTFRTLQEGWTYAIVAFGDFRISDIDLLVYREISGSWVLIDKDKKAESNAVITIKPSITSMYKIDIEAYKFVSGYTAGHYGLLIIHE